MIPRSLAAAVGAAGQNWARPRAGSEESWRAAVATSVDCSSSGPPARSPPPLSPPRELSPVSEAHQAVPSASHPRLAAAFAGWIVRSRWVLALVAVGLVAISVERASHLEFSRSIDAMFDRSDPALVPYRRMARTFGGTEVVLAVYEDPQLFTPTGIARLAELTARLESEPGVATATSLATTPLGPRIIATESSPAARRLVQLMEGYVVGADHSTAAIACTLEPYGADLVTARQQAVSRAATIDRLRDLMRAFPEGTVAGEPAMLRDGFAMLEWDGTVLAWASVALTGGVLLFFFRSLRWVLVPMGVVLTALWTTRGLLSIAGAKLTMVSTMLSAMITVVAIATVTHVIVEYRRRRDLGQPPARGLEDALATLAWPICGAIATDIVGFAALTASQVGPVHDFGVMTAIGAGMVLLAVALVLPFLALAGRIDGDPRRAWGETWLETALDRLVRQIVARPRTILTAVTVGVAAAVTGMAWLEVETDFTRNFRPESPTVASYDMVESRLGGAGVWDVLVPVEATIDAATLVRVARLEDRLRQEVVVAEPGGGSRAGLTKVMSVADVITAVSPVALEDLEGSLLGNWAVSQGVAVMQRQLPQLAGALLGQDPADGSHWLRIMLRARERQPAAAKREIIAGVRGVLAESMPAAVNGAGGAEVTGFFVLLSQLVDRMLADQWLTFGLAAAGIFLLLSVAFQSPLLAAVALVPNGLPIVVVLGLLGWVGVRINMGTAMIAAVSLGLSVDSSIHYIASFRRHHNGGRIQTALETAHQTAGRAMIFSTLALAVGFLALTTSGFMPTVSFGWLSCLTLLGGLAGNLVVLPVLLTLLGSSIMPAAKPTV
jgi:predicted RND superfamily exporter protein